MAAPLKHERGSGDSCIEGSRHSQSSESPPHSDAMGMPAQELYHPLNSSQHEIRLLRLGWNMTREWIECSLETFNLDSESMPTFCALSYEWNPPSEDGAPQTSLFLNGKKVVVSLALAWAVKQILEVGPGKLLWIDALCINQNDPVEKSHQVQLMKRIYREAYSVYVWPGLRWTMAAVVKEPPIAGLLEELAELILAEPALEGNYEASETSQSLLEGNSLHWEAFKSLFSITYWQRCWIVQELVLARLPLLLSVVPCATAPPRYLTTLVDLRPFLVILFQIAKAEDLCQPNNVGLFSTSGMDLYRSHAPDSFFTAARILLTQEIAKMEGESKDDLLSLLVRFSSQLSSKRSDKVYSLLGIAQSRTGRTLDIDYTLAWTEVFKKTAAYIIQDSGTLDILTFAGSGSRHLPTWVPDWSGGVTTDGSIFRGLGTARKISRVHESSVIGTEGVAKSTGQLLPRFSADLSSLTVTALLYDLAPDYGVPDASKIDDGVDSVIRSLRRFVDLTVGANIRLYDLVQPEFEASLTVWFMFRWWATLLFFNVEAQEELSAECFFEIVSTGLFTTDKRRAEPQRRFLMKATEGTAAFLVDLPPEVGSELFPVPGGDEKKGTDFRNLIRLHQVHVYLPGLVYPERLPQPLKRGNYVLAVFHRCQTPMILRKVDGKVKDYEVVTWAFVTPFYSDVVQKFEGTWPIGEVTLV